jgi:hypothetical protein
MPAGHTVIDPFAVSFVWTGIPPEGSNPYSRQFGIPDAPWGFPTTFHSDPVLFLTVGTKYSSAAFLATVRINGNTIGFIFPRPQPPDAGYVNMETVTFLVNKSFITASIFPVNTLTVTPGAPGFQNALWIRDVLLFYRTT